MHFPKVIFLTMILAVLSCEKKVSVATPVVGSTTTEQVEIVVSTDIPKVNRKLKKLKTNLQNTMDKRESDIDKKLPTKN